MVLALDLLDDKFAAPSPRVEMKLIHKAVGVLQGPPTSGMWHAADALQRATLTGSALLRSFVADAARTSLAADPPQRITAAMMMRRWSRGNGALAALGRQRTKADHAELGLHAAVVGQHYLTRTHMSRALDTVRGARQGRAATIGPAWHRTVAGYLRAGSEDGLGPATFDVEDARVWDDLLRTLDRIAITAVGSKPVPAIEQQPNVDRLIIERVLTRPAVADHLAERLLALDPDDWAVGSTVVDISRMVLQSRPAGDALDSWSERRG